MLAVNVLYGALSLGGSLGAASLRYYLPLWPMLAHAVAVAAAALPAPLAWGVAALAALAVLGGFAG